MNAFVDEYRRHFKNPGAAMNSLIAFDKFLKLKRGARDEEPEDADPAERLHRMLAGKLSPEELKEVGEILLEIAQSQAQGEAEEDDAEDGEEGEAERRASRDDDEFEETRKGGREYSYEPEDPEERREYASRDKALGAKRGVAGVKRVGAMDEAANERLFQMIPNLRRIQGGGGVVAVPLAHDGRIQNMEPRKSSAGSATFNERFPALKRLVA